ncbi:unnamed protein product [Prorocentrum cordatum]|uniref:Uncharacterized protein n=1 Tax=Prorocentrum cordatum TaxID=2364126 RepID=A0ABN9WU21_9DINO|nr:unnamed protein product [Polarella glacialis]
MADATAAALLSVIVRAGASRQVVAATAVALWRAARADEPSTIAEEKDVDEEVQARVERITPVLRAKVVAAHAESKPNIDGEMKAQRNMAEHALFGEGADALPKNGKEAKRRQRTRRHRAPDGVHGGATPSESELSEGIKGEATSPDLQTQLQDISKTLDTARVAIQHTMQDAKGHIEKFLTHAASDETNAQPQYGMGLVTDTAHVVYMLEMMHELAKSFLPDAVAARIDAPDASVPAPAT